MKEIQPGQARDKIDSRSYMPPQKKLKRDLVPGACSSSSSGNSGSCGCGTNSQLGEMSARILKK